MATNKCQVKEWNLSFNVCAVFRARRLLQKSVTLQQVFTVSWPTDWGMKGLCKVDSTSAQRWPKGHTSFSHRHPSAALKKWRQCIPWSHFNGWGVTDAFIWPSAEMTECWMACPNVTEITECWMACPNVTEITECWMACPNVTEMTEC